jgi:hypothetical protein
MQLGGARTAVDPADLVKAPTHAPRVVTADSEGTIMTPLSSLSATAALAALLFTATGSQPAYSQAVELLRVDVTRVAQGYRASKLIGSSVVNDKNEKIGTLDEIIIARDRVLFAVLQVGGFLGLGGRLVAVEFAQLKLDDGGAKITLAGASKDELGKLPEFKYQ